MKRPGSSCITCKIRKIKCDGKKPHCSKCNQTGRRCDGYAALPFTGRELRAASRQSGDLPNGVHLVSILSGGLADLEQLLVCSSSFQTVTEKRYFQFFRHCTVAGTNLMVDSRFWDRLILQSCDAEKAIKHAVLAIAAFHNSTLTGTDRPAARQHLAFATKQYQTALQETSILIASASSKHIERVLMVCVLFILYDGMRGDFSASQAHMASGRAIATHNRRGAQHGHEREIEEVFARLDVLALTFSDAAAPYQYTLNDLLDTAPNLHPSSFGDIRQAHASLVDLLRWLLVLGNHVRLRDDGCAEGPGDVHLKAVLVKCALRIAEWRRYWLSFAMDSRVSLSDTHVRIIELWYLATSTMCTAGFDGPETRWDSLHSQFVQIVQLGEAIATEAYGSVELSFFSLDTGYIVPMFFCAIRCRDPPLRRRAIHILELRSRREGIWESTGAAAIARRWMDMEEEGLDGVKSAEEIPDAARIALLDAQVDYHDLSATLRFTASSTKRCDKSERVEVLRWGLR